VKESERRRKGEREKLLGIPMCESERDREIERERERKRGGERQRERERENERPVGIPMCGRRG